jgi:hypothetical protein
VPSFSDYKPGDLLITATGQRYKVLRVFTAVKDESRHYARLAALDDSCQRGRPERIWQSSVNGVYEFDENTVEWMSEQEHHELVVTQQGRPTSYWVVVECFMDDEKVHRGLYRMADDICDAGTTNLFTELGEIAAQLDRDAYQIVHNGKSVKYNRIQVGIEIDHGQEHLTEHRLVQPAAIS